MGWNFYDQYGQQKLAEGAPSGLYYRKTTAKTVNNTVAETDLLNGEITVAANLMSTDKVLRLTAWGTMVNNTGAARALPRWRLKLGGSTLLDTSVPAGTPWGQSAETRVWRLTAEIANKGAANQQLASLHLVGDSNQGVDNAASQVDFATGTGTYGGLTAGTPGIAGWMAVGHNSAGAVDTSLARLLEFSVINGVAHASYETTLLGALVEIV